MAWQEMIHFFGSLETTSPAFFLGALTGGGITSWLFSVKVDEEIESYQCQPTNQPVADKSLTGGGTTW